jgi:hypothetical protein
MEDEMDELTSNMAAIMDLSDKISGTLQGRRQQITKLAGVHTLLKKVCCYIRINVINNYRYYEALFEIFKCYLTHHALFKFTILLMTMYFSCSSCLSCQRDCRSALRWKHIVQQLGTKIASHCYTRVSF